MKRLIVRVVAFCFDYAKRLYFFSQYSSYRVKYDLADDFRFNGDNIKLYGNGKISIGGNSYIGAGSTIQSVEGCSVTIGRNCSISHNVRIYTSSNATDQNFDTQTTRKKKEGSIILGNGVWIGVNVVINPGITIGSNVVIGANSVVTKDVADYSVVGGVPARLIKRITIG